MAGPPRQLHRLRTQRAGVLEPAPHVRDGGPGPYLVPAGQWRAKPIRHRADPVKLGLGAIDVTELSERVEPPQPPPQHGVVVALLADGEQSVAEGEPLLDALRTAAGDLPGPQRFHD